MNLWDLKKNATATISGLAESIPENYRRRLSELGFHMDEHVLCVHQTFASGPRLYQVGNCVYSLESDIARSIVVIEKNVERSKP